MKKRIAIAITAATVLVALACATFFSFALDEKTQAQKVKEWDQTVQAANETDIPTLAPTSADKVALVTKATEGGTDTIQYFATLEAAMQAIGEGTGTYQVVFCANYTQTAADLTAFHANGANATKITFMSTYNKETAPVAPATEPTLTPVLSQATMSGTWQLSTDTEFRDIKLNPSSLKLYGCGHHLKMGQNITKVGSSTVALYGGSATADLTGNTYITVNSGSYGNIVGGSDKANVKGDTHVSIGNATCTAAVSGGGYGYGVEGNTGIYIKSGTYSWVCGGGYSTNTTVTGDASVIIDAGSFGNPVVAGSGISSGTAGTVTGNTSLTINSGTFSGGAIGGGYKGAVDGNSELIINGGTFEKSVFGACNDKPLGGSSKVTATGATFKTNVVGGGTTGAIGGDCTVSIKDSTVATNVYAGCSDTGVITGNTSLTLENTKVTGVTYGGSAGEVKGDAKLDITGGTFSGNVYGGCSGKPLGGSSTVTINGGSFTTIVGGNNGGNLGGSSSLTITGATTTGNIMAGNTSSGTVGGDCTLSLTDTTAGSNVFGGGNSSGAITGNTSLSITGGSVGGNTIAGNKDNSAVNGNSTLTINGGTYTGYVIGGSNGKVNGSVTTNLTDGTYNSTVIGGCNNNSVTGAVSTTLNGGTYKGNVYGGCSGGNSGDVTLAVDGANVTGNVYGGPNTSHKIGNLKVDITNTTITGSYYNMYHQGSSYFTTGNTAEINISDSSVGNIYGDNQNASTANQVRYNLKDVDGLTNISAREASTNSDIYLDGTINATNSVTGSLIGTNVVVAEGATVNIGQYTSATSSSTITIKNNLTFKEGSNVTICSQTNGMKVGGDFVIEDDSYFWVQRYIGSGDGGITVTGNFTIGKNVTLKSGTDGSTYSSNGELNLTVKKNFTIGEESKVLVKAVYSYFNMGTSGQPYDFVMEKGAQFVCTGDWSSTPNFYGSFTMGDDSSFRVEGNYKPNAITFNNISMGDNAEFYFLDDGAADGTVSFTIKNDLVIGKNSNMLIGSTYESNRNDTFDAKGNVIVGENSEINYMVNDADNVKLAKGIELAKGATFNVPKAEAFTSSGDVTLGEGASLNIGSFQASVPVKMTNLIMDKDSTVTLSGRADTVPADKTNMTTTISGNIVANGADAQIVYDKYGTGANSTALNVTGKVEVSEDSTLTIDGLYKTLVVTGNMELNDDSSISLAGQSSTLQTVKGDLDVDGDAAMTLNGTATNRTLVVNGSMTGTGELVISAPDDTQANGDKLIQFVDTTKASDAADRCDGDDFYVKADGVYVVISLEGSFTVSKQTEENEPGTFNFKVHMMDGATQYIPDITLADWPAEATLDSNNDVVFSLEVSLLQTNPEIVLPGIKKGIEITVTEAKNGDFTATYSINGGDSQIGRTATLTMGKNATVAYYNQKKKAAFVIKTEGFDESRSDPSQVSSFTITDPEGNTYNVTLVGNEELTIDGCEPGDYTVTQNIGWGWRYTPTGGASQTKSIVLNGDDNIFTFSNSMTDELWVNANSTCKTSIAGVSAPIVRVQKKI